MTTENKRVYWGLRTFCLVTGASRGIGQELAYQFSRNFKPGSLILLLSRTEEGLQKTKSRIESDCPGVDVKVIPFDLYNPDNGMFYDMITNSLKEYNRQPNDFEHAIIVHNTGVLMHSPAADTDDLEVIHKFIDVNLNSAILLTVQFLKIFTEDKVAKRSVIQTSSMASQLSFPGLSLYCMCKAARNMYFKALATENPSLDVFSYGPGLVDTTMLRYVRECMGTKSGDSFWNRSNIITTEDSVKWLVEFLAKGNYKSGEFKDVLTADHYDLLLHPPEAM